MCGGDSRCRSRRHRRLRFRCTLFLPDFFWLGETKRPTARIPTSCSRASGSRARGRCPHPSWCRSIRPAAVKAGIIKEGEKVRFGFHNFRHSLATALVKLKVDPKTVQGMLRHEDFGTTMELYAQSDMESMRDAQGKFLEQLMGDKIHLLTERVQ